MAVWRKHIRGLLLGATLAALLAGPSAAQSFRSFGARPERAPAHAYAQLARPDSLGGLATLLRYFRTRGSSDSVAAYASRLLDARHHEHVARVAMVEALLDQGFADRALAYVTRALAEAGAPDAEADADYRLRLRLLRSEAYRALGRIDEARAQLSGDVAGLSAPASSADSALRAEWLSQLSLVEASPERALARAGEALQYVPADEHRLGLELRLRALLIETRTGGNADDHLARMVPMQRAALDSAYYDLYTVATAWVGDYYAVFENYQAAEIALSSAYVNSHTWGRVASQRDIADRLRAVKQAQGDYANAYALLTQRNAAERELRSQQDALESRRLDAEYRALERERDILRLSDERRAADASAERARTRQYYLLGGFLVLLVPLLALLYTYYQKLQTQSALSRAREAALQRETELEAARAAVDAQERERARIGRQLHDSVGGNLAAIKLQLGREAASPSATRAVEETYALVRDLSHDLVPARFGESGLTRLIEEHLRRIATDEGPDVDFVAHPRAEVDALAPELQAELFAVAQELLTNTLKHARAEHVELHVNAYPGSVQLLYEDDGVGFDAASAKTGLGLGNVRARAAALGATLVVDAAPGRGVAVTLEVPR